MMTSVSTVDNKLLAEPPGRRESNYICERYSSSLYERVERLGIPEAVAWKLRRKDYEKLGFTVVSLSRPPGSQHGDFWLAGVLDWCEDADPGQWVWYAEWAESKETTSFVFKSAETAALFVLRWLQ